MRISIKAVATFAALAAGIVSLPAAADDVADFYKGKQLQLTIGHEVGGGYDVYARLLGRHMGKYIPGNPRIIPQNMLGAGSRTAANWLYRVAPKDGSVFGMTAQTTPLDEALQQEGVAFKSAEFNWIGNPIVDNQVFFAWHETGINRFEEAPSKGGLFCGGTNASTNPATLPRVINYIIGSDIKLALGYPSARSAILAMERKEVNCIGSYSWATAKATVPDLLRERQLNVLVQWGPSKDPEISQYAKHDVPMMNEYARTDEHRALIAMISSGMTLGRPLYAPPGVPAARVAALRKAFDDAVKDPALIAEAEKAKMDLRPISGAELQTLVAEVMKSPPAAVAKMREILNVGQ